MSIRLKKTTLLSALYICAHAAMGSWDNLLQRKDAIRLITGTKKSEIDYRFLGSAKNKVTRVEDFFFMKGLVNQSFTRSTRISRNARKALQHG